MIIIYERKHACAAELLVWKTKPKIYYFFVCQRKNCSTINHHKNIWKLHYDRVNWNKINRLNVQRSEWLCGAKVTELWKEKSNIKYNKVSCCLQLHCLLFTFFFLVCFILFFVGKPNLNIITLFFLRFLNAAVVVNSFFAVVSTILFSFFVFLSHSTTLMFMRSLCWWIKFALHYLPFLQTLVLIFNTFKLKLARWWCLMLSVTEFFFNFFLFRLFLFI